MLVILQESTISKIRLQVYKKFPEKKLIESDMFEIR